MQIIENSKVKEKLYIEKLENGLTIMFIPKKGIRKKYIIFGTHYGSNDSVFKISGENDVIEVPKGVAHFLEHKLFEQENGKNSLDVLSSLGVNANAYTTNNHTAYLYECVDNFYEALDEFMNYVQNPYFTDENVKKEKGIIEQEIMMYEDYPEWRVYLNALEAMYFNHPIKLDITGTCETISKIDKEILYKCYNTFYIPSNMAIVVVGDFEPHEIIGEINKRIIMQNSNKEINRIFENEPEVIVKSYIEQKFEVSKPLFTIGIKDMPPKKGSMVKKHIAIEIILNILFGSSSELYKELYDEGNIFSSPSLEYDYDSKYSHILISGKSLDPKKMYEKFKNKIQVFKNNGFPQDDFNRTKKMIYGEYVKEYDDVADIARMFLADYFKGVNSFDYLEEINSINIEYINQLFKDVFREEKMILSIVKS